MVGKIEVEVTIKEIEVKPIRVRVKGILEVNGKEEPFEIEKDI